MVFLRIILGYIVFKKGKVMDRSQEGSSLSKHAHTYYPLTNPSSQRDGIVL
jgi:hypothetical protein